MSQNGYMDFFKSARATRVSQRSPTQPATKKNRPPRPKAQPPLAAAVAAIGLAVGLLYAIKNEDSILKFLSKVEVTTFGKVSAKEPTAKTTQSKMEEKEKTAESPKESTTAQMSKEKGWTSEQSAIFNKLEERKLQLDAREKELLRLEEELQQQKVGIERRLKELEGIRNKISSRLDEKVKVDQEKVDKLVEFYSSMKPQNAAKIFEDIDEDLAVEILNKMKKKSAADIMNLLKLEKAQKLSEKFAGYIRN